jgi:hypothetical protein
MNPTKRIFALCLALCYTLTLIAPTYASGIEPMTDGTDNFRATLSIGFGGQATCNAFGSATLMSHKVEAIMSLNRLGNPIPLKTWNSQETGGLTMSENYYVSRGYDYQVSATITVRDSGGRFIESFTIYSAIVHY